MPRHQQLITQVPGSVTVGDRVKWDGLRAEVVETGLPGEYGPRVAIRFHDGTEIVTTPDLDHRWQRERDNPLPSLTELLHGGPPSEMRRAWVRRQLQRRATAPHGQCERAARCVEHARNRRVPSCK